MLSRDLAAVLADGESHSGADLATRFGVTRAAVWKHIEELRTAGLDIAAVAGRGYRLAVPFELLDAAQLRAALPPALAAALGRIDVRWEIDSTNTALLRAAAAGEPDRSVWLAERQSAGRGRRGRSWQSPLGNVYLSFLKRFEVGMGNVSGLSLAGGIAVAQAVTDVGVPRVGLKWPNDIYIDGAKLAGILVELAGEFLGPCHAVIGIGVNLRAPLATLDQPVADIASLTGGGVSRQRFIAALLQRLHAVLERFDAGGFAAVQTDFASFDALRDRPVRVSDAGGVRDGIAVGVDARGALCVRYGDAVQRYDSADVTVRPA